MKKLFYMNHIIKNLENLTANGNYGLLKKFFAIVKDYVTVDLLMNVQKKVAVPPERQFYYDLVEIFEEDMKKQPDVYVETFINYYRKQYLSAIYEVENNTIQENVNVVDNYLKAPDTNSNHMTEKRFKTILILYKSTNDSQLDKALDRLYIENEISGRDVDVAFLNEQIRSYFKDGTKYDSYIKRCRRKLAKSKNMSEDKLKKELLNNIQVDSIESLKFSREAYAFTHFLTVSQGAGIPWYNALVVKKQSKDSYKKMRYYPDIDCIIESYYRSKIYGVIEQFNRTQSDDDIINGIIKTINFENDFDEIIKLSSIDVVYHLFKYTWKQLYEIKLIELKAGYVSAEIENSSEVKLFIDQSTKIAELENKLESANYSILEMEEGYKKKSKEQLEYNTKAYQEISKKLLEAEEENKSLKKKIEIQEQLLEEMQKTDPEPESELDFTLLKGLKYLFAGRLEVTGLVDLKREFPNSIFLESETADISNIKVDAIILLTKGMSHGMFYKLKSITSFENIPWIYYNSKNIVGLYTKMYNSLFSD